MFVLAKLLTQLVYPLTLCLLLVPLGLLAMCLRWRRIGGAMVVFGLGWVVLWSLPMTSFWLRASLERQTPQRVAADYPVVDAIVVLGGGVDGKRPGWRDRPDLSSAADRVWFAADLYHAGRAPLLVLSGGADTGAPGSQPESAAMADFIRALGVPEAALVLEGASRNTWENASFTRGLLQQRNLHKILLVTSALHMPRALALFRKQGVDAVAAPTDFEAVPPGGPWLLRWMPDAGALERSGLAMKEYLGLWVYRLRGMAT